MDTQSKIFLFFISYLTFCILLKLILPVPKNLKALEKWDYLGQHISLLHGCASVLMSLYIYTTEGGVNYNDLTNSNHITLISVIHKQHTMGYLLYDLIYAEIFGFHDWSMRAHHIFVLIGGIVMCTAEYGGSPATICIMLTEGTNPVLKVNKILKIQGKCESGLFKFTEAVFFSQFVLFRVGLCTLANFNIWMSVLPFVTKLMTSATYIVGLVWVAKIISIASKKFKMLEGLRGLMKTISRFKGLFIVACLLWGIAIPLGIHYSLNPSPMNIKINSFTIL